jgi:nucleoside-diphosphate-sugar epimerase
VRERALDVGTRRILSATLVTVHRDPAPRSVLVTGASGFIGSHVVDRFLAMGWRVTGIGRRAVAHPSYRIHDLTQPIDFDETFDVVIHGAALASPWGSRREFERQNVLATQHVLDFCARTNHPRLVAISTSSVYYRDCDQFGITEETPLPEKGVNQYATTKREAERRIARYAGEWMIVRPRAVFGPRDTVLLPRILTAARAGKLPLLTSRRGPVIGDLIYVVNLVDCIVRAATDRSLHGIVNVTNNEPVPLQAFLIDLLQRLGLPAPTRRVPVQLAMAVAGVLELTHTLLFPSREPAITRFGIHVLAYSKTFDVTKMLATMGEPRVSLATGVERTVAWLQQGGASSAS